MKVFCCHAIFSLSSVFYIISAPRRRCKGNVPLTLSIFDIILQVRKATGSFGRTRTSGGGKAPPCGVEPIGLIHMGWCIPAAGHTGPALREYTEHGSGRSEGPKALSPQQCEAWIERVTAPIQNHRTMTNPYHQSPGGAEGPLALSPQQCEAWIENLTAQIRRHRTKSPK